MAIFQLTNRQTKPAPRRTGLPASKTAPTSKTPPVSSAVGASSKLQEPDQLDKLASQVVNKQTTKPPTQTTQAAPTTTSSIVNGDQLSKQAERFMDKQPVGELKPLKDINIKPIEKGPMKDFGDKFKNTGDDKFKGFNDFIGSETAGKLYGDKAGAIKEGTFREREIEAEKAAKEEAKRKAIEEAKAKAKAEMEEKARAAKQANRPQDDIAESNRRQAELALERLMEFDSGDPEARAAKQAEFEAGRAEDILAARSMAGRSGMGLSGAAQALESDIQRQGLRAQALGMEEYDRGRRQEEAQRLASAIGLTPELQRSEFEKQAFDRAMAILDEEEGNKPPPVDSNEDGTVTPEEQAAADAREAESEKSAYLDEVKGYPERGNPWLGDPNIDMVRYNGVNYDVYQAADGTKYRVKSWYQNEYDPGYEKLD